jgi:hypothetical protein
MKINSELERILLAQQQAQQAKTKSADSSTAFEDILQSAMQKPDATNANEEISLSTLALSAQNMGIENETIASTQSASEADSETAYTRRALMADIENSLSSLDMYTQSVQSQNAAFDLKQAWQGLTAFNRSVNDLRQNYASLSEQDSSLDAMINDLEIMAVTETYKFNRGDYSL